MSGYYVRNGECDIRFHDSKVKEIMKAVKSLKGQGTINDSTGNHFSWVNNEVFKKKKIIDLFNGWRFAISKNDDYYYIDYFTGEKSGDEETFLETIAPYVEKGGFIEFTGEDDEGWAYKFDGNKCECVSRNHYYGTPYEHFIEQYEQVITDNLRNELEKWAVMMKITGKKL